MTVLCTTFTGQRSTPRFLLPVSRFRVNSAHTRQSAPDSGPGLQMEGIELIYGGPSLIASGQEETCSCLSSNYRVISLIRTPPPQDPTVALCLGTCGDPRGLGVSYERGTPVHSLLRAIGQCSATTQHLLNNPRPLFPAAMHSTPRYTACPVLLL